MYELWIHIFDNHVMIQGRIQDFGKGGGGVPVTVNN